MNTITFDTHEFFIALKTSGFSDEQSEAIIRLQKASVIATLEQAKHDFELDDIATNRTMDSRIKETELKIELVRSELKRDLAETKSDLIRWVVSVGLLQTALVAGLLLKLISAFP